MWEKITITVRTQSLQICSTLMKRSFFFPRCLRFQGFWDPMVYQLNLLNPFHWIRFQKKYSDGWETSVDELGLQKTTGNP